MTTPTWTTHSIDTQVALRTAAVRLADEFRGVYGTETIERFLTLLLRPARPHRDHHQVPAPDGRTVRTAAAHRPRQGRRPARRRQTHRAVPLHPQRRPIADGPRLLPGPRRRPGRRLVRWLRTRAPGQPGRRSRRWPNAASTSPASSPNPGPTRPSAPPTSSSAWAAATPARSSPANATNPGTTSPTPPASTSPTCDPSASIEQPTPAGRRRGISTNLPRFLLRMRDH